MGKLTVALTMAEANHIINLIVWNERDQTYAGPRGQYFARSERIKDKLCAAARDAAKKEGDHA